MKLTKIHRVLKFKQSDWMEIYIGFNIKKRKNAANSFEKKIFKLMINSVYGKTMENLQKNVLKDLHSWSEIRRDSLSAHKWK